MARISESELVDDAFKLECVSLRLLAQVADRTTHVCGPGQGQTVPRSGSASQCRRQLQRYILAELIRMDRHKIVICASSWISWS